MKENSTKAVGVKIQTDGQSEIVVFNNPFVSLKELQEIVNGHIEFVYLPNNMILVVNEEGKLNDLPVNQMATCFVSPVINDFIVGNVLLINKKYID